jgi:hypothetical protein
MNARDQEIFTDRLARIEKDLFGYKSAQLSGGGNTYSYIAETANTWDATIVATTVGAFDYAKRGTLVATFTANTKPVAFTAFEVDFTIDGIPYYKSSKYLVTGDALVRTVFQEQASGDKEVAKYQYSKMFVYGANGTVPSPTTLRIKIRAVSVDVGTLNVVHTVIA